MRRRSRARSVLLSILISAAILLPSATFLAPALMRWRARSRVLDDLTAAQTHRRERGLNALISRAATDEALRRGAAARLRRADPDNVVQILNALRLANAAGDEQVIAAAARRAASMGIDDLRRCFAIFLAAGHGDAAKLVSMLTDRLHDADDATFGVLVSMLKQADRWRSPPVPAPAYLRWLALLTDGHDAASRITAARRGGRAIRLADEAGLHELVAQWIEDRDPVVRREALLTAAELATVADARRHYLTLIARSRLDADVAVARRAWILLDQFNDVPAKAVPPDPRPAVAAAWVWATRPHRDDVNEALRPLIDSDDLLRLVGMLSYTHAVRRGAVQRDAIQSRLESEPIDHGWRPSSEGAQVELWRTLLALRALNEGRRDPASRRQYVRFAALDADDTLQGPLVVVAAHCDPGAVLAATVQQVEEPVPVLAAIEGLRVDERSVQLADDAPPLVRVMATAVTRTPDPEDLKAALGSRESTLRDLACTIAIRRFPPDALRDLVESLLRDFNDNAKQSGAILAGLSGVHGDLLARRMQNEDNWTVRQLQRLGMWLQGQPVPDERGRPIDMPRLAASLLARDDLPRSTILLAMLHMRRAHAAGGAPASDPNSTAKGQDAPWGDDAIDPLAMLLHPRGSDWIDLHDMLATRRWWLVLQPYLPEESPPLWIWADRELQEFQLEVLRCWYLVHHRGGAVASHNW